MRYPEKMKEMISLAVRKSIFDAATELIREEGWPAFTTERIADRAGVSRGVLYNYFENKEDIARSIIRTSIELLSERIRAVAGDNSRSSADRLREMARINVEEFVSRRELHLVLMEHLPPPDRKKDNCARLHEQKYTAFTEVIREGVKNGEFADSFDVECAAMLLWGGIHEICLHSLFSNTEIDEKAIVEIFLRGIKK